MSETIQSSKHYCSIDRLPLNLFWDICVSGDKTLLIIDGIVPLQTLEEAWEDITYQYTDIISPETSRKLKKKKRIAKLQAKYNCVYSCLHLIRAYAGFDLNNERIELQQKICDILNYLFPGLNVDYKNSKTLLQKLKSAESKAKNWVVTINELKKQSKEKSEVNIQVGLVEYQNMLTDCNIYHKLTFSSENLTVLAFATYYKRMIEGVEHQKRTLANSNGRIRKH